MDSWDFGRQKSLFSVILGARGHFLEARGPISTIFGFVVISGAFGNEKLIPFGDKNLTTTLLLGVLDFGCFLKCFFISLFGFWEAGGSILDLMLALSGRPLVP